MLSTASNRILTYAPLSIRHEVQFGIFKHFERDWVALSVANLKKNLLKCCQTNSVALNTKGTNQLVEVLKEKFELR